MHGPSAVVVGRWASTLRGGGRVREGQKTALQGVGIVQKEVTNSVPAGSRNWQSKVQFSHGPGAATELPSENLRRCASPEEPRQCRLIGTLSCSFGPHTGISIEPALPIP